MQKLIKELIRSLKATAAALVVAQGVSTPIKASETSPPPSPIDLLTMENFQGCIQALNAGKNVTEGGEFRHAASHGINCATKVSDHEQIVSFSVPDGKGSLLEVGAEHWSGLKTPEKLTGDPLIDPYLRNLNNRHAPDDMLSSEFTSADGKRVYAGIYGSKDSILNFNEVVPREMPIDSVPKDDRATFEKLRAKAEMARKFVPTP